MLRGAIVGFGNVAQFGHWPAYAASPEVEIVAVVDGAAERRFRALELQPSLGAFASLKEIGCEAIDFVDICTPPAHHAEPMREAVAKGWHVLCEKPFLLDRALLDEVRTEASSAGVAVLPVHNWKYAPLIQAATAQLRAGAIGRLEQVEITTLRIRDAATADQNQPNWRRDPRIAGGGILMDHGWHSLYLAGYWFNEQPQTISAELHRPSRNSVEDEAMVEIGYSRGTARVELSWNASTRTNHVRLRGDSGEMLLADDRLVLNGCETLFRPGLSAGSHHADWFASMLPDVVAAFRQPGLAGPIFEEAASCLANIQHAYRTARWRDEALSFTR